MRKYVLICLLWLPLSILACANSVPVKGKSTMLRLEDIGIEITHVELAGQPALAKEQLQQLLRGARVIAPGDPLLTDWQYAPWLRGSFTTPHGTFTTQMFLGGLAIITAPDSRKITVLFEGLGKQSSVPYYFYVIEAEFAGHPLDILGHPQYTGIGSLEPPVPFSPRPAALVRWWDPAAEIQLAPQRGAAGGRLTLVVRLVQDEATFARWAATAHLSIDQAHFTLRHMVQSIPPGNPTLVGVHFGPLTPDELAATTRWMARRSDESVEGTPVPPGKLQELPVDRKAQFSVEIRAGEPPLRIDLIGDMLWATTTF